MPLRSSRVNCVRPASGETSETAVSERSSDVNCVRFASGETSETAVPSRFSHVNCMRFTSGETADTAVPGRFSDVNCVRFTSGETSETPVSLRTSDVNCVRFASGETSDIGLVCHSSPTRAPLRFNDVRLSACSSPVRSAIPLPGAANPVKSSIASAVMTASVGKPRASRMAAAKFSSGMETSCAVAVSLRIDTINTSVKVKSVNFFIIILLVVNVARGPVPRLCRRGCKPRF